MSTTNTTQGDHTGILNGPQNGKGLPQWWLQSQQQAWDDYNNTPMPTRRSEEWRFANIKAIADLSQFAFHHEITPQTREQIIAASTPGFTSAGQAIFGNNTLLHHQAQELKQQGIIWEPLEQAIVNHPDMLKQHFMSSPVTLGSQKFAHLHRAHSHTGMFLYVPKNTELQLPLTTFYWLTGSQASSFPHTLIVADDNSKVTVVDFYRSQDNQSPGFACAVNDLILGRGAKVNYITSQFWNCHTVSFQLNSTHVERDAEAKTTFLNLGGKFSRLESKSKLNDTGARSEMLSATIADGKQEFDQRTFQEHAAPNTWSDLLYKNVLNDQARTIFSGLIYVQPGANQTDAYQTNNNLLLNPEAEANTMPGLEILSDEVKCSHGATTGQLNEQELYYMQTRGIHTETAKKLMSFGFFEEVIDRIENEEIANEMRKEAENKFLESPAPSDNKKKALRMPERQQLQTV